jgi:hypothetical protein
MNIATGRTQFSARRQWFTHPLLTHSMIVEYEQIVRACQC